MRKAQKIALLALRVSMGWLFFYAGITKVLNPEWSAEGYLTGAQMLNSFFSWLATPANLMWINPLNEWGLTLIGVALILGVFVRWASYAGTVLMILYWLPVLSFPYAGEHFYVIDDHIIYLLAFVVLAVFNAGRHWGLEGFFRRNK